MRIGENRRAEREGRAGRKSEETDVRKLESETGKKAKWKEKKKVASRIKEGKAGQVLIRNLDGRRGTKGLAGLSHAQLCACSDGRPCCRQRPALTGHL